MASLKERLSAKLEELRQRRPALDHVIRMVQHYGEVKGNLQAGAVTYFAFLSFFPILALAFATVGYVSRVYPDAQEDLLKAIEALLPDMVGEGDGQISLTAIEDAAPGIFSVGLLTVLYAGLGWLSAMRDALRVVFEEPLTEQPNFFVGKGRDLLTMVTLGLVLMLSVAVSSVVTTLAEPILEFLGLGIGAEPLLWALAMALGLAASSVLFFALFRLLADPDEPTRALWAGALLGAVGFEALKQLSRFLLAGTAERPAFQAFGIALILVVWINYFSRVVMFAAAWAFTDPASRAARERAEWERAHSASVPEGPATGPAVVNGAEASEQQPVLARARSGGVPFAAGSAAALAAVAYARRRRDGRR
ncbi:YihY/virulence factor BrkB family protein [Nocardioides donggukensis]|uniref:YihY/virulence factor BrkB family protein n=1 Tax=Nocardioides donggukensis TaxID=2774019 RepID=A0A927PZ86_9ACTN|nr:YihY/virulence factor BrkB family protein [Nocardioides donggukensis]MBD8868650.1 YihY/virulence factor BrkB family protein [Nocardioides donggukensis]